MQQPLVSVVIATYNMAQYLPDAVDSVLAQKDWDNLEVVIVDDGSADDTEDRMTRFSEDSRVRYIRTENRGQPKAKNRGIYEARGEFIAFCDADDIWQPDKLAMQMPVFQDEDVGVVYSEVAYINHKGSSIPKEPSTDRESGWVTSHLVIRNFVPFGTAVMRRSCIERQGTFDEDLPMGIDWDLWLRFSVAWKFVYVPEVTYLYRIWPGQMSKNYRGRYDNAFKILNKFLKSNPGAVPSAIVSRAWADMYVGRAMCIAQAERSIIEPMRDLIRGLRFDVTYYPAWKSLAKLFLRRV
ncbi:glycosyltransferase family 2 protein [Marinobacter halotolerans]|uniref:glycosyltransferase family 2 protein n=1 Tax=Marinobacter halotolerans TaxID=1569211 RepID=UPI001248A598|nr:glycosyltransferase [Marinobacter halotolerans]